jgi:hypothetical protein
VAGFWDAVKEIWGCDRSMFQVTKAMKMAKAMKMMNPKTRSHD